MSDQVNPGILPTITDGTNQTGVPTLTSEQTLAMRSAWVAYGYSSASFDAAVGTGAQPINTPAPSEGEPSEPVVTDPREVQVLGGTKSPPLSQSEAEALAQALVKSGADPETVRQALVNDGFEAPIDNRTDEQREYDAQFWPDGLRQPESYRLSYQGHSHLLNANPADLAKFDGLVRGFASELNLDPHLAQFLLDRSVTVATSLAKMDDTGRGLHAAEQTSIGLRSAGGPDELKEVIRQAGVALGLAKDSPAFVQSLFDTGAINDWAVISTLANHGAHHERWQATRPKDRPR